ncbi:ubiquitin carboxyl-terminal hydrolase 17 [Humulus lupulus]|uniref:ubiquitin carboxyl-terminal hydrolase 17 n=1 Tax=Humulus lupulus TaxID=3486 RepID=UPI002B408BBA|nr:ubiquitin carboxyl-terminal hydrolase 17 [Humulus lupulus]
MLLFPGILGFHALLFFSVLLAFSLIRRKWRNAAAKEEEVLRLLAMASEESAMAEVEARALCDPVVVSMPHQCVVCYCPTTMRCSQCKSVRYCSGKCQIIHWRQGHKDECRPPISIMQFEDKSDLCGEVDSFHGTETGYATCADGEPLFNIPDSETYDRIEKPLFNSVVSDLLGTAKINDMEVTNSSPSSSVSSATSADSISCTNTVSKMDSIHGGGKMKSTLQLNKDKTAKHENVQPAINLSSKKLTEGTPSGEKLTKDTANSRRSVSNNREDDLCLFKRKEDRSLSSVASAAHPSSSTGEHFVSNSKSTKGNGYHALPVKSSSVLLLPQNARTGLKTSMLKVVQQFRVSKQSKCNASSTGTEIAGKHKLIFPYELFVKLYTNDMMVLRPFGLTNCGNSCYANAVLQCLSYTRPFTSYLLQGLHSKTCGKKDWCFICEFQHLIYKAREGNSPLSPIGILSKINKIGSHLGHGREEDAHEFLRYAVDTMQSVFLNNADAAGSLAEETTLVGMTFGGYLRSKIKCMRCLGKSELCERMMDLTVEIDGEIGTLEEALAQFTATETLDRDNKYYCSRCKSYEKAKKKLTVLEAPNILTIVLKRFKSGNFEKLSKSVQFPEELNMTPYMSRTSDRSPLYSLYAVVVHLNNTNAAFSGHYVCYVKNIRGEWFRIDDSTVVPVELERVLSEGAYMLLYERHTPRHPALLGSNMVNGGKFKRRNLEAVPSSTGKLKSRSNFTVMDAAATQTKFSKTPNPDSSDPYDWRSNPAPRFRRVDSSSENSSILSCSDASSSSTVSTKDSGSTDDFSDYIFGKAGSGFYRQYEQSSGGVASSSSYSDFDTDSNEGNGVWRRLPSQESSWDGEKEGNSTILYTDTNKHRRKSTSQFDNRSSSRETEFEHVLWANPFDVRAGVSLRRVNGERSAQTFYEV